MSTKKAKGRPPEHCRGCQSLWAHGIKDGKHNRWCAHFGRACDDVVSHCKNTGGREAVLDWHKKPAGDELPW